MDPYARDLQKYAGINLRRSERMLLRETLIRTEPMICKDTAAMALVRQGFTK